jgi:hypothetical protein
VKSYLKIGVCYEIGLIYFNSKHKILGIEFCY